MAVLWGFAVLILCGLVLLVWASIVITYWQGFLVVGLLVYGDHRIRKARKKRIAIKE